MDKDKQKPYQQRGRAVPVAQQRESTSEKRTMIQSQKKLLYANTISTATIDVNKSNPQREPHGHSKTFADDIDKLAQEGNRLSQGRKGGFMQTGNQPVRPSLFSGQQQLSGPTGPMTQFTNFEMSMNQTNGSQIDDMTHSNSLLNIQPQATRAKSKGQPLYQASSLGQQRNLNSHIINRTNNNSTNIDRNTIPGQNTNRSKVSPKHSSSGLQSFRHVKSANNKVQNNQRLFNYQKQSQTDKRMKKSTATQGSSIQKAMDLEDDPSETNTFAQSQSSMRAAQEVEATTPFGIIATLRQLLLIYKRNKFQGIVPPQSAVSTSFFVGSPTTMAEEIFTSEGKQLNDEVIKMTEMEDTRMRATIQADSKRTRIQEIQRLHELAGGIQSPLRRRQDTEQTHTASTIENEFGFKTSDEIAFEIEKILTYYTKKYNIVYRQGLNEILGPFYWLAIRDQLKLIPKGQRNLTDLRIYSGEWVNNQMSEDPLTPEMEEQLLQNPMTLAFHCMKLFVEIFIPSLYHDQDFTAIQSCFCLLRLLLKYHDPEICQLLESTGVSPQLYTPRFFYTVFANKCDDITTILHMWQQFLKEPDQFGVGPANVPWWKKRPLFTMILAVLNYNRNNLLSVDPSDLLEIVANLGLTDGRRQLEDLFMLADHFYFQTPISVWESNEMNVLFGENSTTYYQKMKHDEKIKLHLSLEKMSCLPIQIAEFFKNVYVDSDLIVHPWSHSNVQATCANPKCFAFNQLMQQVSYNHQLLNLQKQNNFNPIYQRVLSRVAKNIIEGSASGENASGHDLQTLLKRLSAGPKLISQLGQQPLIGRLDIEDVNENARIVNGPTFLELCQKCRATLSRKQRASNQDAQHFLNIVPIDTRAQMLQNEALLLRCTQLPIVPNQDKRSLNNMIMNLQDGLKDVRHLCLLGLKEEETPMNYNDAMQKSFLASQVSQDGYTIEEFHSKINQLVIEMFWRQGFKFVSQLPGGFEQCHKFIADQNKKIIEYFVLKEVELVLMQNSGLKDVDIAVGRRAPQLIELVNAHWSDDCYHCYNITQQNDEELPFAISQDIHVGIAPYGPINSDQMELEGRNPQSIAGASANIETTTRGWDSTATLPQQMTNQFSQQSLHKGIMKTQPMKKYDGQFFRISAASQNEQFEMLEKPQSEDNEGGFNFFKGLGNIFNENNGLKKFFGLGQEDQDEMPMMQGDRSDELLPNVTEQTRRQMLLTKERNQSLEKFAKLRQQNVSEQVGLKKLQAQQPQSMNVSQTTMLQAVVNQQQKREESPQSNQRKRIGQNQLYASPTSMLMKNSPKAIGNAGNSVKQSQIQKQLSPEPRNSTSIGVRRISGTQKLGLNFKNESQNKTTIKNDDKSRANSETMDLRSQKVVEQKREVSLQRKLKSFRQNSIYDQNQPNIVQVTNLAGKQDQQVPQVTQTPDEAPKETKQPEKQEDTAQEKKTPMAQQQFLLEERSYYMCNGIQSKQIYSPHSTALVGKIILEDQPKAADDIVIYHVKRLASSHLQQTVQHMHQQMEPQEAPQIFGMEGRNPQITSIVITQFTTICLCQAHQMVQSRFFMHDLIKITSRKSSAKIITFYFRIPIFKEYNSQYYEQLERNEGQENVILQNYNNNPSIPYQFAYKRKKYVEVKMGFEFKSEEQARDCIERVSILYKRLKNLYREEGGLGTNK